MSWLVRRSLVHFWRTNLAVVAGVATAIAVLSGALLVGLSVRQSLGALVAERLGRTDVIVSGDRFFGERLAADLGPGDGVSARPWRSCPIVHIRGVLLHEATGRRTHGVDVHGVDDRFWRFHGAAGRRGPEGRTALVGAPLAAAIGARPGDGLLLRIDSARDIPLESLYGRRDGAGRTIRLECGEILPADRLGEFSLGPAQGHVLSVFVPLGRLQQDLGQPSRANVVLLAGLAHDAALDELRRSLRARVTLDDLGVKIRPLASRPGVAVESARVLLDESVARAALDAASDAGLEHAGVFSYLANSIRAGGREIPYSVITAADLGRGPLSTVRIVTGTLAAPSPIAPGDSIWLNEWAWRDLAIVPGDPVEVDYYVWRDDGSLVTETARFRLAGVVAIGGDIDAALAPDVPGITGATSLRRWDPPFPLDLRRIRQRDEDYWREYGATPKAFIPLARGQELWQSRFGRFTAVRVGVSGPAADEGPQPAAGAAGPRGRTGPGDRPATAWPHRLEERLRSRVNPETAGLALTAVRQLGLDASQGAVDLGAYFVAFSFFVIVASILVVALFFRLGVEQRAREIGMLEAVGFPSGTLRRIFLVEGGVLAIIGCVAGASGALGYGGLLVLGLNTWWNPAVGIPHLTLYATWRELAFGAAAGLLAALGAVLWALRTLRRLSPRALLAGLLEQPRDGPRRAMALGVVTTAALAIALLLLVVSGLGLIPHVAAFFGAGASLLVVLLGLAALYVRRTHPGPITGHGWRALIRLATRNVSHKPARSLLCVGLIAAATFIIVSVEAFRKDPRQASLDPGSGTGGYPLVARAALPLAVDPNSEAGREVMGIPVSESPELAGITFVPFRERAGDDVSCLNPYAALEPRILGATHTFLAAGRFSFAASAAVTPDERRNPWLLLESPPDDGAIPAIGDANTIQYILRLAIGSEIVVRGSGGAPVRLRIVAALRDSILQGELVVSETNFLRAFPGEEGFRFFLLDVPAARAASLASLLGERLADWGFSVESSLDRLATYHEVENTYLSTFQSLGALGLVLGTVGLAAVLLRNVLERRGELALLRAVGFRRPTLATVIVAEHMLLMVGGLACGTICAFVAILPAARARGGSFPFVWAAEMLGAVVAVGLVASLVAVMAALRAPLLDALSAE